jgi:vanillate O-demethylase ferredoxin subunit
MRLDVTAVRSEPGDVLVLEMKHPRKPELPAYEPGAHVDVHLPNNMVRQYSLCGPPDQLGRYTIAVKREASGRGGSIWLHENVRVGMQLPVSAPRNHFRLVPSDGPVLLLAGGIGITPLYCMAQALQRANKAFGLHYFARSRALTPLLTDISSHLGNRVHFHFDDELETHQDIDALFAVHEAGAHAYYCGPPGFMKAVAEAARAWPADSVHFEAFQATSIPSGPLSPFTIVLKSGKEVPVPSDTTALAALRDAGITLPSSCETGVCGTCECGYLEGEAIHRDSFLPQEKRGNRIIPCVSRAVGRMKLDL